MYSVSHLPTNEREMMARFDLSEEDKRLLFAYFDAGLEPRDVRKKVNIPYTQIVLQRRHWNLKRRGFTSWKDYQDHLARKTVFASYSEYRRYLTQKMSVHPKAIGILTQAGITEAYGERTVADILGEFASFRRGLGLRGRELRTTVATIIYGVLRKQSKAETLDNISERFGVCKKDVTRIYKVYTMTNTIPMQTVGSFIRKGCKELGLSNAVGDRAKDYYECHKGMMRRFKPQVSAAVCLYLQSQSQCEWRTRKEIGEALGVSAKRIADVMRMLRRDGRL